MPLSAGSFDGHRGRVLLSRLALRHRRAVHRDPGAGAGAGLSASAGCRSAATRCCEVQGNIWVYFGDDPAAAPEIPLVDGFADAAPAAGRDGQLCRRDRPRRGRADGPGARALCPSRLVVALAPLDPGQGQGVRALALGLHDEPPCPVGEFARLPAAWAARPRPRSSFACRACASSTSAPAAIGSAI